MGLTYEQSAALGLGHLHPDAPGNKIVAAASPLPPPERVAKYRAEPSVHAGVRYASKAEANHARRLDADKAAGVVDWWVRQVPVMLGEDHRTVVDFLVCERGRAVFHEVKGADTPAWRRTRRLWRKRGPSHGPKQLLVFRRGRLAETLYFDGRDEDQAP